MRGATALGTLLLALYPLIIFAGLYYFDPRTLGALVLLLLLLRHRRHVTGFVSGLSGWQQTALGLPVVLGLTVVATNSETLLLLYPAAVNASMLLLFGMSLIHPPTTIERIARLREPGLSPAAQRYTRILTAIWCGFFVLNGTAAAYTALGASREAWVLYNGFIAYLLMGALLAGERIARPLLLRSA